MEQTRRRTVLADIGGQMGQGQASSIPVPSSAMKKQVHRVPSNSRMSEMARASQSSSQGNNNGNNGGMGGSIGHGSQATGSMGVPRQSRQSIMPGQQAMRGSTIGAGGEGRRSTIMAQRNGSDANGGASAPRGDAGVYGRTPSGQRTMPSSVGRASLYGGGGGRQSMAPLVTNGRATTTADIRPIREQGFQASAEKNIMSFLREHRCPIQPDERFFNGKAATRDVHEIIRWLVKEFLDPGRVWEDKKVVDDLQTVLRDLRYPYQGLITRTMLETAGSGQGWATICAFIDWLVNLCKAHTHWADPDIMSDPIMTAAKDLPITYEFIEDRLLWDYMARSYYSWFNHSMDDDIEAQADIEDMYDKLAQQSLEENGTLSTELQRLTITLQQLQAEEPPLKQCHDENMKLKGDRTDLLAYIEKLEVHKRDKADQTERYRRHAATLDEEISKARAALAEVESAVAAQNLTPDEVLRMTQQPEMLRQAREDLERKKDEEQKRVYNQELDLEAALDQVEMMLGNYTTLARQIGLLDVTAEELRQRGIDPSVSFAIDPAILNANVAELTSAAKRLRAQLWPAFQAYKERFRRELDQVQKINIEREGEHDKLCQETDVVIEAVETMQMKLNITLDNAEQDKATITDERNGMKRMLAERQTELKDMTSASEQGIVMARSELEQTQFEFREIAYKTELLQKSVQKQVETYVDVIMKAKEHLSNGLKSLRVFAENH